MNAESSPSGQSPGDVESIDGVTRLTPDDLAILRLESETVAGHTCKVVVLGARSGAATSAGGALERLRSRVTARLARTPELTRRLGVDPSDGAPAWVADPEFDVTRHVQPGSPRAVATNAELQAAAARAMESRLQRDRPLWQIDVVELADGGCALIWRIHHSVADGMTAMRLARELLWDDAAGDGAPPGRARGSRSTRARSRAPTHAPSSPRVAAGQRPAHITEVVWRELVHARHASPLDGTIGAAREVAFTSFDLAALRDAGHALEPPATVNDVVLTVVGGGLRRWLETHHDELGCVRLKVPVSLHTDDGDAANRDSFFFLHCPIGEPDPLERLRAVRAETALRKRSHDPDVLDHALRTLRELSPRLARFVERVETNPRMFALTVSNVPGPARRPTVTGAPVDAMYSLAEIRERHAMRVSAVSLAGRLYLGICADPSIVGALDPLVEGLEADAAALARRGARTSSFSA